MKQKLHKQGGGRWRGVQINELGAQYWFSKLCIGEVEVQSSSGDHKTIKNLTNALCSPLIQQRRLIFQPPGLALVGKWQNCDQNSGQDLGNFLSSCYP